MKKAAVDRDNQQQHLFGGHQLHVTLVAFTVNGQTKFRVDFARIGSVDCTGKQPVYYLTEQCHQ